MRGAIHHNCCPESVAITAALIFALGACHAEQKFPASSLVPTRSVEAQWFTPSLSGAEGENRSTDLSFLNDAPAGKHGFVRAQGGHFVDDRAERLRFFGVNLSGVACLPEQADADRLARTFRRLGFNAVRLHGLDAAGALLTNEGQLNAEALARLDYFSAALAAQGLYFSFNLHASAGYPGLSGDAAQRFPQGKVLDRFHEPFLLAQQRFARALLGHDNPFTKRAYREEPALLYVELSNEDTIFPSWAGSPDDAPPEYRAELAKRYGPWLAARTAEGKRAPGPADDEAAGALPTFASAAPARSDYAEFLRSVELESVQRLMQFVRSELGLRSMLINTQASFGGLAGVLRERAVSDFIDVDGYWDMPQSAGNGRWTIRNTSQITAPEAGTLGVMASYRVFDKPFVVSEYAAASPNAAAAEMFPLLVGVAGLQDWDALFAFAYADQKREYEPTRINGVFDLAGHPSKLAFVGTAALAFRRGLVAASPGRVELSVPEQPSALPVTENALPELWKEASVPRSTAVLRQMGISLRAGGGTPSSSHALHPSSTLGSDTGELLWVNDGPHPRFSVDAPALKLVCGQLSNSALELSGVGFEFPEFTPDFACASLVALDDAAIAQSRRLLLTVVGRAENSESVKSGSRDATTFTSLGAGPALAQFVPFTLALPSAAWQAQALAPGARSKALLPGRRSQLATDANDATLAYLITR